MIRVELAEAEVSLTFGNGADNKLVQMWVAGFFLAYLHPNDKWVGVVCYASSYIASIHTTYC